MKREKVDKLAGYVFVTFMLYIFLHFMIWWAPRAPLEGL